MSRQQLKKLWAGIPNPTPEQVDAFNAFYAKQPNDAYKTFSTEDDFNKYIDGKVSEKTKPLTTKIHEFENKENIAEAKSAFKEAGYKESMFKYISKSSFKEDNSFNEKSKTKEFWKEVVDKLEDKENYSSTETNQTPPVKKFTRTIGDGNKTSEDKGKNLFF